ncbi:unnamed protein product [Didymodactylos carnosus]|uniref:Uncharacterized protein n=1 Tax=Didymodactylos carnosus TaxID=1234261 RepID=A0A8S2Y227_9BILA|nr:unnamed protein product [Didymodactylos carnosus]CAF4525598.1 unnamed protein product [Didymodactylos carnosus]
MVISFIQVFTEGQNLSTTKPTKTTRVLVILRWVLSAAFPTVNFKRALFNVRLHDNNQCINALNAILASKFPHIIGV